MIFVTPNYKMREAPPNPITLTLTLYTTITLKPCP